MWEISSLKTIMWCKLLLQTEGGPIPAAVHSQLKLSVYIHACSPISVPPGRTVCPPPTGSVLAHKLMVASRMERWLEPSLNKVYIDVFKVYILLTFLSVLDEQDKTATSCHLTSLVWVKQAFCTRHSDIKCTEILLWLSNMTSVWARCTLKS